MTEHHQLTDSLRSLIRTLNFLIVINTGLGLLLLMSLII